MQTPIIALPGTEALLLIEAVILSTSKIGIDKTISNLSCGLKKGTLAKALKAIKDTDCILQQISLRFDITADEIKSGNGRKNERLHAIGFCAYYLHYIYKYEMEDVAVLLNKNISVCYKYSKVVTDLNPRHTSDQRFLNIKSALDLILQPDSSIITD